MGGERYPTADKKFQVPSFCTYGDRWMARSTFCNKAVSCLNRWMSRKFLLRNKNFKKSSGGAGRTEQDNQRFRFWDVSYFFNFFGLQMLHRKCNIAAAEAVGPSWGEAWHEGPINMRSHTGFHLTGQPAARRSSCTPEEHLLRQDVAGKRSERFLLEFLQDLLPCPYL